MSDPKRCEHPPEVCVPFVGTEPCSLCDERAHAGDPREAPRPDDCPDCGGEGIITRPFATPHDQPCPLCAKGYELQQAAAAAPREAPPPDWRELLVDVAREFNLLGCTLRDLPALLRAKRAEAEALLAAARGWARRWKQAAKNANGWAQKNHNAAFLDLVSQNDALRRRAEAARRERDALAHLLSMVTLEEMGGTPDLFTPVGGWETWDEAAREALTARKEPTDG